MKLKKMTMTKKVAPKDIILTAIENAAEDIVRTLDLNPHDIDLIVDSIYFELAEVLDWEEGK